MKKCNRGMLFLLVLTLALMIPAATVVESDTVTISRQEYEAYQKYNDLEAMYQYIKAYYYIEPDLDEMMEMAKVGLMSGLKDHYSFYYPPEDFARMWEDDEGNYVGVGIQILGDPETGLVLLTRVFRDSPAEGAGLRRGDYLIGVDDLAVDVYSMQDAVDIMRGTAGEPVTLTVLRGEETLTFTMNRAAVAVNLADLKILDGDIGYLAFYAFDSDSAKEVTEGVDTLLRQGAKGIILDLRDNTGGWTDDAYNIADLFLNDGIICTTENRGKVIDTFRSTDGKVDVPLVVLVNEMSASSSEILAGALKDHEAATLVGTRTFGKGVMQAVLYVGSEGAGFQYTMAEYKTPNGTKVNGVGILPDVICEYTDEQALMIYDFADDEDPQLTCARETMRQILDGTFVKPDLTEYLAKEAAEKAAEETEQAQ